MSGIKKHYSGSVFLISLSLLIILSVTGIAAPQSFSRFSSDLNGFIRVHFGWFYLLSVFILLSASFFLAFGPYASYRLGADDEEPEFGYFSWLAMLFSAGMGIGLVFYGVSEPVLHYMNPPDGLADPETPLAARYGLRYAFFHWGLHPWGIYSITALAIAWTQFRVKDESGILSSVFRPVLGGLSDLWPGKIINIFAVTATATGVAVSLGLGAAQIASGISWLTGIPDTLGMQLLIIPVVTVLFIISASTGLNKGILILSNLNLILALLLMLFVFTAGPTVFILDSFTTSLGGYLDNLVSMSFRMTPFSEGSWVADWTVFYWAWWITWAPFTGTFIARISRGRTIREFIISTLLVPAVMSALWFSVFGGTALHMEIIQGLDTGKAVKEDITSALFITLSHLPFSEILIITAVFLIVVFFITSADSATFVLGMLSSGGSLNPSLSSRITWGLLQSVMAASLLYSGGLKGLQAASIAAALPFTAVLLLMVISLFKSLDRETTGRSENKDR